MSISNWIFHPSPSSLKIATTPETGVLPNSAFKIWTSTSSMFLDPFSSRNARHSKAVENIKNRITEFQPDQLQTTTEGWRLSVEWDALQPERLRLLKPILYIYAPEDAYLSFSAKVFADTFPKPFVLDASVKVRPRQATIKLEDLIPNWKTLLEDEVVGTGRLDLA